MVKPNNWRVLEMDLCREEELPLALIRSLGFSKPSSQDKDSLWAIVKYGTDPADTWRFEFINVGKTPKDIVIFMRALAKRDGVDLDVVAKRLAGEDY